MGVLQGSILGPILFILYINNLCYTSEKLKYILFADDTNLLYSNSDINALIKITNAELCTISCWFKLNKLSLNIKKLTICCLEDVQVNILICIK